MEYNAIHITTVKSTNSYLKEEFIAGRAAENTVVIADYQDAGRGQGAHVWVSEKQKNLLFSWIVFPAFLAVSHHFSLSKAVSLGIVDALDEIGLDVDIKWPNDILFRGRKIAGILIENSIMGSQLRNSIIGIGLNVNQKEFPVFPVPASSICNELESEHHVKDLFELVMKKLGLRYDQLVRNKEEIDQHYAERLFGRNISCEFETRGEKFSGKILGVNSLGELEINVSGSVRTYGFHELRMLIPVR